MLKFILQRLPVTFCSVYGEAIPEDVTLVIRTGEDIPVGFEKEKGVFLGMKQVFKRFMCVSLCKMFFQYNGGDNFWVHVIANTDVTEMDEGMHIFVYLYMKCLLLTF